MKDEWQDPEFAAQWDQEARAGIGNATRAEQVDMLLSYIADFYKEGNALLDLGMGSGGEENEQLHTVGAGVADERGGDACVAHHCR